MYPATISYSCFVAKNSVRNGRNYTTYTDLGDMQFDIPFSEFAKRSDPCIREILAYIMAHCDEERVREELLKLPGGNRYLAALTRQVHKEVA